MADDLESALRQLLKNVMREVAGDLMEGVKASARHQTPQSPAQDRFLLTPRETAKRLAISKRHLFHLTRSGQLPCVRVGKCVRYNVETIQKWVRETEATDQPSTAKTDAPKQTSTRTATSSPRGTPIRPASQKQRGQTRLTTKASLI